MRGHPENWHDTLHQSLTTVEALVRRVPMARHTLAEIAERYPFRINPYYFSLIEGPGDPVWRQVIPDVLELSDDFGSPDPLAEEPLSPVPHLIHRYPDRVVLLVSNQCAAYCRFCMRKRRVGKGVPAFGAGRLAEAAAYLRRHPEVRDVILSGGDPLMLETGELEEILRALRAISHVEILRIHTRAPCTLPHRITASLVEMLRGFSPLYVNVHFNHPREITAASAAACARLADAGIPLGNQSVLLKGVNDSPGVLKTLFRRLLEMRVRPYYLHHPDPVRGTGHFRPSVQAGLRVMADLQGHTSGMCLPHYVIDVPGGGGKVPLQPDYIQGGDERVLRVKTYTGKLYEYPL
jgi:lysine 2,3-aminomutase